MTQQVSREPLAEPLLRELPPTSRSDAPPPARAAAPVAWIEFTSDNGRGRAVLTAFLLGLACSVPILGLVLLPSATPFCAYLLLLISFHMSEYLLTAAFRPDTLGFDNFLLNHSVMYQVMVSVAWVEYWLEWTFLSGPDARYPGFKQWSALSSLGLLLCLLGLSCRAVGMATASTNFSHKIEDRKRPEHTLVTHGIYSVLRHPAYFGFFWWSVLLLNPVCLLAYTGASWFFFYDRIPHEEDLLLHFFGEEYINYRRRTVIGIPFIETAARLWPQE